MKPVHYALLFHGRINAAQDSGCPYQYKCADSVTDHLKKVGKSVDQLIDADLSVRSKAAAEVVVWGLSAKEWKNCYTNRKMFEDLFKVDPYFLWNELFFSIVVSNDVY